MKIKHKVINNLQTAANISAAITVGVCIAEFDFNAAGIGVFVGFTGLLYVIDSHFELQRLEAFAKSDHPIADQVAKDLGINPNTQN